MTFVDTARAYGESEAVVGRALRIWSGKPVVADMGTEGYLLAALASAAERPQLMDFSDLRTVLRHSQHLTTSRIGGDERPSL